MTDLFFDWQALMTKHWRPEDDDHDDWLQGDSDESGYADHQEFADDTDDDSPTVECSKCGCDIYEDAAQCPLCGEWQEKGPRQTHAWAKYPGWFILLGVLGIIGVIVTQLWTAVMGLFSRLQ